MQREVHKRNDLQLRYAPPVRVLNGKNRASGHRVLGLAGTACQVAGEPVTGERRDLIQGARLLEQVRGVRHDLESRLPRQRRLSPLVERQDLTIAATDD